jgi:hypothetical protein
MQDFLALVQETSLALWREKLALQNKHFLIFFSGGAGQFFAFLDTDLDPQLKPDPEWVLN